MSQKQCPYPGLRPFTEEETIFFKGRDTHVRQIIHQLEEKHVVVVTGASGDGKSSLVYAGIVPNAKAGFFRAHYNNWLLADFRPERTPLNNLSNVLATCFEMDVELVKEELELGFSSLVDLYKSTPFYIDTQADSWKNASENEQKLRKSKAANLFILADQFEEFFTNSENFIQSNPSDESYTTVNLLLETARIAYEEKLPIYVVLTMRSDFISQCVAFKGLPETIGFSQFFIPRLKRHELQQVIEEPAILSGGTISKRLTEILINELHDGFDRLPVLQHALNRLWLEARNGEEVLDLMHLAKLGGLDSLYLSDTEQMQFKNWLSQQPAMFRSYFNAPSLANVLNAHADLIGKQAKDYSHSLPWLHTKLTEAQVAFILQISFRSLTKSDAGRAVRNRMTLREIAQIINEPGIGYKEVCAVLNVFRLPDNTFVRPFLDPEDVATEYLHPDTVLDITHESLIRNWQSLIAWQKQEYSDYKNYTDFRVQLERWVQNEKSVKYLLGSGALSHYQDWYDACKPNRYWIAKYNEEIISVEAKISSSSIIAGQIIEFLGESAQHIMRSERLKRRTRIAFYVSSLVTIVVLSALSFWAFREKMNAEFQQGLAENQSKIAESETQKAITANGIAVQERENAEQNAKKALEAENLALQAKEEAEKQRGIAVAQSEIAKDAAQNAFKQRNIAQTERENAEKQRSKAEEASTKAEQLSFLSLAQALAYKAQNNFSDPQLNLLLANQAYLFHTLNGGEQNNPIINTGLRMALRINNYDNHFDLETKKVVLAWGNTGGLGFLAKNGDQGVLELATDKVIKGKTIHTIDIERAFRLTKSVCFGTQDGQILLLPDGSQNTLSLPSDKTLLRGAVLLPNDTYAYISRSGLLQVWNQSTMKVVASVKIQGLPTSLRNKENNLYVSTNEGRVYKWAVGEKTATEIYNANQRINLMEVSTNNIVLALASGKLDLLDLISYKYVRTGVSLPLPIQNFKYDPTTRTLAIEDGASVIRVYNIDRISESPLLIFEHGNKVRQLFFDKGRLYALLYNDKLFFWELEAKVYAGKITEQLSRTFTQEEWETLVSKTIPSGSTKTVR